MHLRYSAVLCRGVILAAGLWVTACKDGATVPSPPPAPRPPVQATIYSADPNHLWNRLHTALFVRVDPFGGIHGVEDLDPLTWSNSRYLVASPAKERALAALEEFLSGHGEDQIQDPVKRAILQHDLWAIYDWISERKSAPEDAATVAEFQDKLAPAIARVALSAEQIAALPDTYACAAASERSTSLPLASALPAEIFQTDGPWVSLSSGDGSPIAPSHAAAFGGRSTVFTLISLPGPRVETDRYVASLGSLQARKRLSPVAAGTQPAGTVEPGSDIDVPPFPSGTRFAQVRRINLIDKTGRIWPSKMVETVHLRTYHATAPGADADTMLRQKVAAWCINRSRLFANPVSALTLVPANGTQFIQFLSNNRDPFEPIGPGSGSFVPVASAPALASCVECHHGASESFLTASTTRHRPGSNGRMSLVAGTVADEQKAVRRWKERQNSWKSLQTKIRPSVTAESAAGG